MIQEERLKNSYFTRVKAAVLVLSLAAFFSIAVNCYKFHPFARYSDSATTLYLRRFEGLRTILPQHGTVGYISDEEPAAEEAWGYHQTQYALSPVIIDKTPDRETVIGNFRNPAAAQEVLREGHLTIVRDMGNGVLLLRKR